VTGLRSTVIVGCLTCSAIAQAELPLEVSTEWERMEVPLGSAGSLYSTNGNLQLGFDGQAYSLVLTTALQVNDLALGTWTLSGTGDSLTTANFRIEGDPLGGMVSGSGNATWEDDLIWDLRLHADRIDPGTALPDWEGALNFVVTTTGQQGDDGLHGEVRLSELNGRLRDLPISGRGTLTIDPSGLIVSELMLEALSAQLALHGKLGSGRDLHWRVDVPDLATVRPKLTGQVEAAGQWNGSLVAPELSGHVNAKEIGIAALRLDAIDGDLSFNANRDQQFSVRLSGTDAVVADVEVGDVDLNVVGNVGDQQRPMRFDLEAAFAKSGWSPLTGYLQIDAPAERGREIAGALNFELRDFSLLEAIAPEVDRVRGALTTELIIGGTLQSPAISGSAVLTGGSLEVPEYGLTVTDITLDLQGRGNVLTLRGSASSGTGSIAIAGETRIEAGWPTSLSITGNNVEVVNIPEAYVIASPDLSVQSSARTAHFSGRLTFPKADVEILTDRGAVEPSEDVIIVSDQTDTGNGNDKWQVYADVELILGDEVRLHSPEFQGRLTGKLNVKDEPAKQARARGELRLVDASATAYGTELQLESGRINYLDTPLDDPLIEVAAVRTVGDVKAGVRVSGYASAPDLELFSVPAMNDNDILSYLLLGRPVRNASKDEGLALLGVASRMAFSNGASLTQSLQQQFGIDELGLATNEEGETRVVAGKYIAPKLYFNVGLNLFEPGQFFTLSYELTRLFTIEATTGSDDTGADIIYEYERN
jgi:autotransporter translocation and assembly factor TamB